MRNINLKRTPGKEFVIYIGISFYPIISLYRFDTYIFHFINLFHFINFIFTYFMLQARLWACGRGDMSTPSFGSHLNPISTRGADYAHPIYWCPHQVLKATGAPDLNQWQPIFIYFIFLNIYKRDIIQILTADFLFYLIFLNCP